ncbi:tRNA(Met) cytidine acetyltransferase TmcA [Haloarculaceae archaeon H-GB1-1]|nr:tRNA(Met) cytidine acetyltransferase TmcA [Haloarculaceae archaeon H-GB1-1]
MDDEVGRIARALRDEARAVNERRVLVLAGEQAHTHAAVRTALDALDCPAAETALVGPDPFLDCEHHGQKHAGELLGRTLTTVVLDASETLRPNALGRAVGAVDGGGLLVLLTPPLSSWPDLQGGFEESLAVPPFDVTDVTGNFRSRLVTLLRAHPGIGIVDCDAEAVERNGLTHPAPRLARPSPSPPGEHAFPDAAYARCLTGDQVDAVADLERLRDDGQALVLEADRGRGKSSAAGIAAGALAAEGRDVLVTAPSYGNAAEVFARADAVLAELDALDSRDRPDAPKRLDACDGCVRYEPPVAAEALPDDPDVVVVDEAAALSVRQLEALLHAPAVAYATTVHGYEGAGRGFSVRFRDRLAESDHEVTEVPLTEPIRYAAGDPLEVWAFRALLLDASPAVDPLVADATPETVAYESLTSADLLADEHRLSETFGLLVSAHYRTEPNDLARLLDAPNVAVRALVHDGHVTSVALLAREGDLPADLRAEMYAGGRVRGNMLPDVLTTQLRDESAGETVGWRVLRIATHHAVRSRGLGSALLDAVRTEARDRGLDWLGVGYGATPELIRFWRTNGFRTVHLSTTRNATSGEHSAIMLDPLSADGATLSRRHSEWFARRIESMLSDPLSDLDPDVVREACRATDAEIPLALTDTEWRLVVGATTGAGMFDTAPRPFRRLALRHLVDPADESALTDQQERLLVRKVLQAAPWPQVADDLEYLNPAAAMRSLGEAYAPIVELYGTDDARRERERLS